MSEKNFIEQLFADSGSINEKEVTEILKNFIVIDRITKEIQLKGEGRNLTVEKKIIVYILAKKLMRLGGYEPAEQVSAEEIKKATGIKGGSVDFSFKKLRDTGFIVGSGSKYIIPNYKVEEAVNKLKIKNINQNE